VRSPPPPKLRWPCWLGVVADDFERQRRFYRDVLGLKETKAGDGFAWFELDGRLFEVLEKRPIPQYDQRRVSFAFEVDDIVEAREQLVARGVRPVTGVEGGPEAEQYWAYFEDAEGNLFELVQRVRAGT
jgi:predicted enzyme related to lactoylglutathione lyase